MDLRQSQLRILQIPLKVRNESDIISTMRAVAFSLSAGMCWIRLSSNSTGAEFSGSASGVSDHTYSEYGLPRGIK